MKTFIHTFNTWALTIALLAVGLISYSIIFGSTDFVDPSLLTSILAITFIAYLAGLPAFFMAWLTLSLIVESAYHVITMVVCWYLLAFFATFLNTAVLLILVDPGNLSWKFLLIDLWWIYACLYISITVRIYYFFRLVVHVQRLAENSISTTNSNTIENGNDN